jgi:hypothetical protein
VVIRAPRNVDEARLLPHLRAQKPSYLIPPGSPLGGIQTLELGGKRRAQVFAPSPQELRGIPVIGRGVAGAKPDTRPEPAVLREKRSTPQQASSACAA